MRYLKCTIQNVCNSELKDERNRLEKEVFKTADIRMSPEPLKTLQR